MKIKPIIIFNGRKKENLVVENIVLGIEENELKILCTSNDISKSFDVAISIIDDDYNIVDKENLYELKSIAMITDGKIDIALKKSYVENSSK